MSLGSSQQLSDDHSVSMLGCLKSSARLTQVVYSGDLLPVL